MDDKLYLTYFHELASLDITIKKQAAIKIVETLNVSQALETDDQLR